MKACELAAVLMLNPDCDVFHITPDEIMEMSEPALNFGHSLLAGRTLLLASKKWRDKRHPNRIPKMADTGEI